MKRFSRGFSEYMSNGGEEAYQQVCGEITQEFNDCSKQVLVFFICLLHIFITFDVVSEFHSVPKM